MKFFLKICIFVVWSIFLGIMEISLKVIWWVCIPIANNIWTHLVEVFDMIKFDWLNVKCNQLLVNFWLWWMQVLYIYIYSDGYEVTMWFFSADIWMLKYVVHQVADFCIHQLFGNMLNNGKKQYGKHTKKLISCMDVEAKFQIFS